MARLETETRARGKFILLLIAAGMVLAGGAWFAVKSQAQQMLRTSEVYRKTLELVQSSPAVGSILGEPVQAGEEVKGLLQSPATGGRAHLKIPVFGPNGKGLVVVEAQEVAGNWHLEEMYLRVEETGEPLPLVVSGRPVKVH